MCVCACVGRARTGPPRAGLAPKVDEYGGARRDAEVGQRGAVVAKLGRLGRRPAPRQVPLALRRLRAICHALSEAACAQVWACGQEYVRVHVSASSGAQFQIRTEGNEAERRLALSVQIEQARWGVGAPVCVQLLAHFGLQLSYSVGLGDACYLGLKGINMRTNAWAHKKHRIWASWNVRLCSHPHSSRGGGGSDWRRL